MTALASLACLCFFIAAPAADAARRPILPEHPLWTGGEVEPLTLEPVLSGALLAEPAPHPLDAYWVGMTLPTLFPMNRPIAHAEFDGLLYLAGSFNGAGQIAARGVVAWDGQNYVSAGDPEMFEVTSLVVWNGALYAGGRSSPGSFAKVSRWDGSSWTDVASSSQFFSTVRCMEVWSGQLVALGSFSDIAGVPVSRAARFDGTNWHAMGTELGAVSNFNDLQSVGSELYAAVSVVGGIRRWSGTNWVTFGAELNSTVSQLTTDGTDLYAAGSFSLAGADSVTGVGRWDGVNWNNVGLHGFQNVGALTWWNGQLVAYIAATRVSRFDGVNWVSLGGPYVPGSSPGHFGTFGSKLVALGLVSPVPTGDAYSVATYDGVIWEPLREAWEPGMRGINGTTYAATVWNDKLVPVGLFRYVGSGTEMLRNRGEAPWDGTSWSQFGDGSGAGPQVLGATSWGTKLVVVDQVSNFAGSGGCNAAAWDGATWSPLLPPLGFNTYVAIEHSGDLFVGGTFRATSPVPMSRVTRWTGSGWASLDGGVSGAAGEHVGIVDALASWNGLLATGGRFDQAGTPPIVVSNIALWDGFQWSDVGGGVDGECYALEAWNGVLVAGGDFTSAGGSPAPGAAYWDGVAWHPMGDEAVEVINFTQIAGTLYGVGDFRHADGSVSNTVARWTGTNWAVLGSGAPAGSFALYWVEGYHGDLYAGSNLGFAFGKASHGIIRLPAANNVGVEDAPLSTRIQLIASPNPGGRHSTFSFTLPQAGRARLQVFDAAGRLVATLADGDMLAGPHEARWSTPASPGVYFARLEALGGERATLRFARID